MNIQQIDRQYVAGTYNRFPVTIVSGRGSLLTDEDGREYIDMGTGIAVNSFGVADGPWQAAVTAQLGRVQHTSNLYYTEPCARLAQMLCTRTGMRRVFFSNSGAEANECAIKAARKWAAENKGPEYSTIVTLRNSFHGRTLTTLAATGQDHYHELFQPLTPGFVHVAAGDAGELAAAFSRYKVAGVLIECIQGEGGVLPLDPEYARALARIVQENDAVLMVDEVQTGNGRTGRLYGYMHYGLEPDVVSTAKGLGGGLPLGATLLGERLQNVFGFGDHGSTFGGNPVCCAGAISILERIDDALLESVRSKGEFVRAALAGAPGIESVAGMGLMLGVKTVRPASEVVAECMRRGVLCLTAKDKVRLLPALNITMDLLEKAVAVIREAARP
jgi:acetylornithine/N-succinyldiaminopimelate aminotransferase